ncbi:hypothetical protein YC2023_022062 [Brassica napus]
MRGRQHQRQLNSDPIQRDVVHNISQNLKKKRTNIDQNNLQHSKKQLHNWELISMIYNKCQIISHEMNVRKNTNTKLSFFSVMTRSTAHRKANKMIKIEVLEKDEEEKESKSSFSNWFYFVINVGAMIASPNVAMLREEGKKKATVRRKISHNSTKKKTEDVLTTENNQRDACWLLMLDRGGPAKQRKKRSVTLEDLNGVTAIPDDDRRTAALKWELVLRCSTRLKTSRPSEIDPSKDTVWFTSGSWSKISVETLMGIQSPGSLRIHNLKALHLKSRNAIPTLPTWLISLTSHKYLANTPIFNRKTSRTNNGGGRNVFHRGQVDDTREVQPTTSSLPGFHTDVSTAVMSRTIRRIEPGMCLHPRPVHYH